MAARDDKIHIATLPWLAFCHMMPWLEFAMLVAQKGRKIPFISIPRNIDPLPKPLPHLSSLIHYVKLPLRPVEGLPQNAEATMDLPPTEVRYLKKALDVLQQPMTQLLESLDPDWVFFDFAPYWLALTAAQLGIKSSFFTICNAPMVAFLGPSSLLIHGDDERKKPEDFTVPPKWVPFPTNVAYRYYDIKSTFDCVKENVSGASDFVRRGWCLKSNDVIAVRSCSEIEPEWLQLIESIHRKPVFPVRQLPPTTYETEDKIDMWRSIKEWLDMKEKISVVYIAFGGEAKPCKPQLTELVLGLELSGLPFFWAHRNRRGIADKELIELPPGFEEQTKGRGVVCTSWAPQLKILAHESVGGFLTQSGWSSMVEALMFGRAVILFTFYADQGINA
ncbi:hypothetical protein GH714_042342 [Hevea brasiliensis]|uniref:Anthocyanidin 3-O-glucosyltransferase n=1 Tax=Hevea brasiliensis TaxID=3981 RepID=A0A6A6K8X0_HEVBR|nr:hypothetical protein GH714_042342 [Hevea brasiliensis]